MYLRVIKDVLDQLFSLSTVSNKEFETERNLKFTQQSVVVLYVTDHIMCLAELAGRGAPKHAQYVRHRVLRAARFKTG